MLSLLLAMVGLARAVDAQSQMAPSSVKTTADYVSDLTDESDPDRVFAARVLRSQVRRVARTAARTRAGTLAHEEARAMLVEFDAVLPDACTRALAHEGAAAACADILSDLGATAALPALRQARASATRKPAVRALDRAISTLSALPGADTSDVSAPGAAP
jgi:hypothetical protein